MSAYTRWIGALIAVDVVGTAAGLILFDRFDPIPAAPKPMVEEIIIGWEVHDQQLFPMWAIDKRQTAQHCLQMSALAGGGRSGAVTVRCKP